MTRLLVAALAVALAPGPRVTAADRPNVLFLLADDLGFGDLGCTGHPYARTPAIDRLAKDGTLFTGFYVGGATCCPSRTAFMTGRFPATFQKYPAGYGFSGAVTVTDLLKKAGYRTGHFGKWHMGPETRDGTFGIDTVRVAGGGRRDPRGRDAHIADDVIEFLKANKAGPFYANVWLHTPHNPVSPPPAFAAPFAGVTVNRADFPNPDMLRYFDTYRKLGGDLDAGMRQYLGDVAQLDAQVARILAAVDDLGLRDNTVVVFTSDNGPSNGVGGAGEKAKLAPNLLGSAGPYRARKHSLYDGGVRQPLVVRWPGHVPAGRADRRSVLAGVDWPATVCQVTGTPTGGAAFDGEDVSDVWLGKERDRVRDLFWRASAPNSVPVVRRGTWKLHLPRRGSAELYDLAADPGERTNVADRHPDVTRDLTAVLRKWVATLPTSYDKAGAKDD